MNKERNEERNAGETAEPMRAAFIDHITIRVRTLEPSRRFYEAAVGAFGGRAVELDTGPSPPPVNCCPH